MVKNGIKVSKKTDKKCGYVDVTIIAPNGKRFSFAMNEESGDVILFGHCTESKLCVGYASTLIITKVISESDKHDNNGKIQELQFID